MRRALTAALAACVASLVVMSSAWSESIKGTQGPDRLVGGRGADVLDGRGGDDRIDGRAGPDLLVGGAGRDTLLGGAGADRLAAQADRGRDVLRCGPGRDLANAELVDAVGDDCEVVSRQLSRDPFIDRSQHETQVEPDSFAFGSTIVTVFQSGRFADGGASGIGFATSRDAGSSWRAGFLPSAGAERVSDPAVAYDDAHDVWLAAVLAESDESEIQVARSRDGLTWAGPVRLVDVSETYDKEWIACDNWRSSRFRGRCYLSYLDLDSSQLRTRHSTDGGLTWSAPATSPPTSVSGALVNGAYPVVRPNGDVLVFYAVFEAYADAATDAIGVIRSTDGGATFAAPRRVAELAQEDIRGMRAPPFPSADVAPDGTVYVAWSDCRFASECTSNDIVLSTSRDGLAWTGPARVPTGARNAVVDDFLPGLAVTDAAGRTRVAIAYYSLPQPTGCALDDCPGMDVGLVSSGDGGRTWTKPVRLNAQSMPLSWIADAGLGRMVGDYISASFVAGKPMAVFSLASEPVGSSFRQAVFATTRTP